ncbi:silicon efflux transporter LSI3-like isoform X2 [Populus nigra]|uniref:silicon efflux transporter LSI3-like isoform X2 n=1 Tax=Populus nigra TaxID=3691 RepID=UPI002B275255|nr:silicon efflux transporter LSI3-like isoform X2 [Populus nigra]
MALGSFKKVVLGSLAFAIFWILAVFPAVPFLPIGRTAGSILGAILMVIFKVITPEQAYSAINLPVLGLLFGTMVVSIYLERADMFKDLGVLFSWKSWGAKDMLCRICIVSAISSALFTNDTACVFLTEFILKIARQNNIRPEPFLLGLASSSNIGSSATPIGNPQNLIIAIQSRISFGEFVLGLLPAVLVGVFVNALILICMFWRLLSDVREEEDALDELIVQEDSESGPQQSTEESKGLLNRWERLSRKLCIYLGTVGMLVGFLMGFNMSWTTLTASLIFVILDFKDAGPCLEKVSYSVLVLFCGMFITVDGFNRTGIPTSFWNLMEPHARIDHASGIAVLAIVILVLSNVASNVPTAKVVASATAISPSEEKKAWLILAWVSTVAGNLSLIGSAANLIMCEQARRAQPSYTITFWSHLKFGVPSTLIVTAIGLPLLYFDMMFERPI